MGNNLPKKYNEGIFYKIRNFFLKIFGKRTSIVNENVVNSEIVKQEQEINKNSIVLHLLVKILLPLILQQYNILIPSDKIINL